MNIGIRNPQETCVGLGARLLRTSHGWTRTLIRRLSYIARGSSSAEGMRKRSVVLVTSYFYPFLWAEADHIVLFVGVRYCSWVETFKVVTTQSISLIATRIYLHQYLTPLHARIAHSTLRTTTRYVQHSLPISS